MAITTPSWIKSKTVPVYYRNDRDATYKPGRPVIDVLVFRVDMSASEFAQNCKTLFAENNQFTHYIKKHDARPNWCGLKDGETASHVLNETVSKSALTDLQNAKGKIDAPLARGQFSLKPTGSCYSMGRVIQGHPIAALRRQKTKLPPLTINLTLQASSDIDPADISKSLARIIRAAWEYKLAGGIVSLKMNFFSNFTRNAATGETGLFVSLNLPLANQATIATFSGVQGYRAIFLGLAQSLSGKADDILPVSKTPLIPGSYPLTGVASNDARILEALKVR